MAYSRGRAGAALGQGLSGIGGLLLGISEKQKEEERLRKAQARQEEQLDWQRRFQLASEELTPGVAPADSPDDYIQYDGFYGPSEVARARRAAAARSVATEPMFGDVQGAITAISANPRLDSPDAAAGLANLARYEVPGIAAILAAAQHRDETPRAWQPTTREEAIEYQRAIRGGGAETSPAQAVRVANDLLRPIDQALSANAALYESQRRPEAEIIRSFGYEPDDYYGLKQWAAGQLTGNAPGSPDEAPLPFTAAPGARSAPTTIDTSRFGVGTLGEARPGATPAPPPSPPQNRPAAAGPPSRSSGPVTPATRELAMPLSLRNIVGVDDPSYTAPPSGVEATRARGVGGGASGAPAGTSARTRGMGGGPSLTPPAKDTITQDQADFLKTVRGWTDAQIAEQYEIR